MEVYEDMESDAPDAPDAFGAPNATTNIEGKENEIGGRKGQKLRRAAVGNRSGHAGVFFSRQPGEVKGRSRRVNLRRTDQLISPRSS